MSEPVTAPWFSPGLLHWYMVHKRPLPWRETTDPYAIWLSEIILQQTRVSQGLPYYHTFIGAYPTVHDLANAPEDEVLRYWQGLGYYSRARNLHFTAKTVASELGGKFPESYKGLLKLKGIGSYTAAAIASFAYHEKVPVLDGNVFRVLARVFGISEDIASPAGKKVFQKLAEQLIPAGAPDTYNQAIMEFGAIQCTPLLPDCLFCPLQQHCFAFNHGLVQQLPVKAKAKAARHRYFHYFVFRYKDKLYLKKRHDNDIWKGLYDFYLYASGSEELTRQQVQDELYNMGLTIQPEQIKMPGQRFKHVLSHQKIFARFYLISLPARLRKELLEKEGLSLFSEQETEQLPKPVLITNYLKSTGL